LCSYSSLPALKTFYYVKYIQLILNSNVLTALSVTGERDVRRADPFASFISRCGHKKGKQWQTDITQASQRVILGIARSMIGEQYPEGLT